MRRKVGPVDQLCGLTCAHIFATDPSENIVGKTVYHVNSDKTISPIGQIITSLWKSGQDSCVFAVG